MYTCIIPELKDKRTELSLCCCYSEFHVLCNHQTFCLMIALDKISLLDLTSLTISPYFFCSFYFVAMSKSTLALLMILSSAYALQLKNQVLCYNVNNVLVGCTMNV